MGLLRLIMAGESHGPKLIGIVEGLPAGFLIKKELINSDLKRRQQGFGKGGRMKIESDEVIISSGIINGYTTGAPVALEILNKDYKNWESKDIDPLTIPRPGHVDYAGAIKYHHHDLRLSLERASARETAMRVAAGSIFKQILSEFNIKICAYVVQIGSIKAHSNLEFENLYEISLKNEFAFIDEEKLLSVREEIHNCMKEKDTLGGVFEVVALGVPVGLGSYVHFDRKLDGLLAKSLMSIPAMKAVEIGDGIINAQRKGTQVHDEFFLDDKKIKRKTNRAGGLEAGVSNGEPILARVYMKPISTTLKPLQSIDLFEKKISPTVYERSDFCAVSRAVVIGEAMMSMVLLSALMEKIGRDNKNDMLSAFKNIKKGSLEDFLLNNKAWRFNYDK